MELELIHLVLGVEQEIRSSASLPHRKLPDCVPQPRPFGSGIAAFVAIEKIEESIGFPANPVFNNKLLRHGSPGQSFTPERDDTRRLTVIVVT